MLIEVKYVSDDKLEILLKFENVEENNQDGITSRSEVASKKEAMKDFDLGHISYWDGDQQITIDAKTCKKIRNEKSSFEKRFRCDYCDYATKVKPSLIRHIRIHTGENLLNV